MHIKSISICVYLRSSLLKLFLFLLLPLIPCIPAKRLLRAGDGFAGVGFLRGVLLGVLEADGDPR